MATKNDDRLTKADALALWHAVDSYAYQVREMPSMGIFSEEIIQKERDRLAQARRALRKVNKLRKGFSTKHILG